jgi:hypothetical protein
MEPRNVPVILYSPPGDSGTPDASGYIADTPENRAALELAAIPRCKEWREAHPETHRHIGGDECEMPAPYCCSAYCDRCAGLRALNGDDPALRPNEWMNP